MASGERERDDSAQQREEAAKQEAKRKEEKPQKDLSPKDEKADALKGGPFMGGLDRR